MPWGIPKEEQFSADKTEAMIVQTYNIIKHKGKKNPEYGVSLY